MFNKSNFCHIASNNRNDQKGSVFIYKTTDTLAQVTQSGYFNEKLIDINVHDLIIHVQYDQVARTLKKSVLIVTERTLDNVETTPILDQTIGDDMEQLGDQVAGIEEKIPENASAQNQLATKSEIPTVPTNISAFNNDSGYITSDALTPYATTQALNDGLATKQPAGDYATNSALTSGLALKVAIAQGAENAGKILKIDDSGNVIVADESGGASLPILANIWSDHIVNDVSWLRADTFSWQSGDVYVAAYEHLAEEFASVTEWSHETVGGVYIGYKLMPDGHKITDAASEQYVQQIYEATGVAWYYILDTTNRQFKLPRTKWGFTGLRDSVGGYVAQEVLLPDITGVVTGLGDVSVSGAFVRGSKVAGNGGGDGSITADRFDASRSSSVYSGNGTNTLIQPRGTQMYLYFYVGNFEQSAIEQTAGITAETLNGKADRNLLNTTDNVDIVIESQLPTADNGYTWYRKYKSGWVEQGGQFTATSVADGSGTAGNNIINLPIEMANDRYWYSANIQVGANGWDYANGVMLNARSTTTMTLKALAGTGNLELYWEVKGMAAQ